MSQRVIWQTFGAPGLHGPRRALVYQGNQQAQTGRGSFLGYRDQKSRGLTISPCVLQKDLGTREFESKGLFLDRVSGIGLDEFSQGSNGFLGIGTQSVNSDFITGQSGYQHQIPH